MFFFCTLFLFSLINFNSIKLTIRNENRTTYNINVYTREYKNFPHATANTAHFQQGNLFYTFICTYDFSAYINIYTANNICSTQQH